MTRRDILLQVAESFTDGFTVSVSPDLPELFEGPDVLAGRSGQLIAIFVPKGQELQSPDRLRNRLILSRLALPDHAQCLLVLNEKSVYLPHLMDLERDFHAVVRSDDLSELRRTRSKSMDHRRIPLETRLMVEDRMAVLLKQSRPEESELLNLSNGLSEDDVSPLAVDSSLSKSLPTDGLRAFWTTPLLAEADLPSRRTAEVRVENGVLIASADGRHKALRERVRPFLALAMDTAFRVDNGVPYLYRPTAGVLVLRDLPRDRSDPLKPLRASAFAGWAVLVNPSRDEFSHSARAARDWLMESVRVRPYSGFHEGRSEGR